MYHCDVVFFHFMKSLYRLRTVYNETVAETQYPQLLSYYSPCFLLGCLQKNMPSCFAPLFVFLLD